MQVGSLVYLKLDILLSVCSICLMSVQRFSVMSKRGTITCSAARILKSIAVALVVLTSFLSLWWFFLKCKHSFFPKNSQLRAHSLQKVIFIYRRLARSTYRQKCTTWTDSFILAIALLTRIAFGSSKRFVTSSKPVQFAAAPFCASCQYSVPFQV